MTFLALDFMSGIADRDYAREAVGRAEAALSAARGKGIPVIFSKIVLRPGNSETAGATKTSGR